MQEGLPGTEFGAVLLEYRILKNEFGIREPWPRIHSPRIILRHAFEACYVSQRYRLRESGESPELSRSGKQERPPYFMHWLLKSWEATVSRKADQPASPKT